MNINEVRIQPIKAEEQQNKHKGRKQRTTKPRDSINKTESKFSKKTDKKM